MPAGRGLQTPSEMPAQALLRHYYRPRTAHSTPYAARSSRATRTDGGSVSSAGRRRLGKVRKSSRGSGASRHQSKDLGEAGETRSPKMAAGTRPETLQRRHQGAERRQMMRQDRLGTTRPTQRESREICVQPRVDFIVCQPSWLYFIRTAPLQAMTQGSTEASYVEQSRRRGLNLQAHEEKVFLDATVFMIRLRGVRHLAQR